ncbi:hypothetical protein EN829_008570 [Mesorhizobium sp. M00.F.Ca.ET.186.01.1.1]|nr:hypothetical protein EN848_00095 [bacterium M00.F.Ca.ET.205.01.1.1]TGU54277.1 hypothetical protein EN795_04510 [bacterium M00.F.Ca.ET.152.01.1.1]TGV38928.1 hypothetical protein EN829_008570 [Mesorhizobium sp. M00.F.Ca.ET.186.01.1.1]TGZ43851.1 hypothetical protein EN805_04515 [bacterium M00.F.Ca.ET.162.01.1.1]
MSMASARPVNAVTGLRAWLAGLPQTWLVALVVLVSLFMPWTAGGNTDVSWLIIVCQKILDGQKLYVDILETNPPFSIGLYLGPVWLAHRLGVTAEFAVECMIYLVFFGALALSVAVVERGHIFADLKTRWTYPALAVLLLIMPGNIFGQREHIGMMLFMPMLFMMMWRLEEGTTPSVPIGLAAAVGLCGSVLLLVKPHWALGIALPCFLIMWRKRSFTACLTPENIVVGAVCMTYLAGVWLWFPEFFGTFLPLLMRYYVSLRANSNILTALPTFAVFAAFVAFQMRSAGWRGDVMIALASAAGFFISMAYLGKYWPNHQYPYQTTLLVAMLVAVAARRRAAAGLADPGGAAERASTRLHTGAAIVVVVTLSVMHHQFYQMPEKSLVDAVKSRYASPSVVQISSDLSVGNPLTRMINGRWLSAYAHDWVGAHALWGLMNGWYKGEDERVARRDLDNYTAYVNALIRDNKPDIILVDRMDKKPGWSFSGNYPPIWVEWMRRNADFQGLMGNYEEIALGDYIEVYARRGTGTATPIPAPSPAAVSD